MDNNYGKGLWLSPLISDGMVLQRDSEVMIWGKGVFEKEVRLSFLDEEYSTRVNKDGGWSIVLKNLKPGGPYDMVINHDNDEKIIKDILVGDVWVLAGQSNMQIPISRTLDLFEEEVKDANYPEIRQFTVPMVYDFNKPIDELNGGNWIPVTPDTVYDFSAVGYFFSKKIYDKYNIPIGLLFTAIGGTPAEAWISEGSLMRFDRFREILTMCKDDSYVQGTIKSEQEYNDNWYSELYQKDEGLKDIPWYSEEYRDNDWREIQLPGSLRGTELEPIRGAIWLRKEIDLPEHMHGKEGKLILGTVIDADDTYINGVLIGNTGYLYPPRRYNIPKGLLKAGKNTITVRMIMTQNIGGFVDDMPYFIRVGNEQIPISGTWKYKVGCIIKPQAPTTFFQYKPIGVYNGMIYPLRNYSIRGVLWYQGESNTGHPYDYKELFETVINDWRKLWNNTNLPFYYVQLPNHCPWRLEPEISGWAQVREAQRQLLKLPNTGMAVIIDAGMYNDLHPWDKKTVGERLSLWALNNVYGEQNVCSGPIYNNMVIEGNKIRIFFDYVGSGLLIRGDRLNTFEISDRDGVFYPAEALIEDDSVVVYSKKVSNPVRVRYAWADNPEGANLYNKEGLPASPFMS
ncbi:MAG: sialate O-acetylesterase [Clostridiales bacterium]|jgi:sialate O-acetylesterase|nr:sialate O-acetylesterase [Clostridiales bacterium]